MLSMYFKPDELAALMEHCQRQMAQIDAVPLREGRKRNFDELSRHTFWDSLYTKLEVVFRHPVCVWCNQRNWDLDDAATLPDDEDVIEHTHLASGA
jgi:hypothetical protein